MFSLKTWGVRGDRADGGGKARVDLTSHCLLPPVRGYSSLRGFCPWVPRALRPPVGDTVAVDGEREVAPAVHGDDVSTDETGHGPRHPEVARVAIAPHQVGAGHHCFPATIITRQRQDKSAEGARGRGR